MSKEAMKLALEVNESMKGVLESVNALVAENKALKEALAKQKPKQNQDDNYYYGNPDKYCRGDERYYANE